MRKTNKRLCYAAAIAALLLTGAAGAAQTPSTDAASQRLTAFAQATHEYALLHRRLEAVIGPLEFGMSVDAINRNIVELAAAIRAERPAAKRGEFFSPALSADLRGRVRTAIDEHGLFADDLHGRVDGVDYGRVDLQVNGTFPWVLGAAMAPCVLAALPALPPELLYRIVDRDLVLIDVHAGLIVDILPNLLDELTVQDAGMGGVR